MRQTGLRFVWQIIRTIFAWLIMGAAVGLYTVTAICTNIPPGIAKMSRGVDITKLDMKPMGGDPDGMLRSLFEFTCLERKTWRNPFNTSHIYDIPDQVETIDTIPGGVLDAVTTMYYKYDDKVTTEAANLGLDFKKGMLSSSFSTVNSQETFINSTKETLDVEAFFTAIRVDFSPFWDLQLRQTVQTFIKRFLPENYTSAPERYKQFIRLFGTHYFESGKFGGLFKVSADYESSLKQTMTSEDLRANAKATFFGILKASGGYNGSVQQIREEFKKKSQVSFRYFGGNTNLLNGGDWKNWWNTVPSNPWLFGGQLESIVDLLPDGPKKTSLALAIGIHIDKAYMLELERILYSFVGKGLVGDDRARALLAQLAVLMAEEMPNSAFVADLGGRIIDFVIAPDWFTEHTELCYDWYPEGDAGQCLAPSRHLCSKVNSMTPYYGDYTDNRRGGCRMSWALKSPTSPHWFQTTSICLNWRSDGDRGRAQCGDHSGQGVLCGALGTNTPWYLDDTDNRPGGCQEIFMLTIPESAPGWALNSKLCFYSYADGDAGQCGNAGNHCVLVNQWTPYYRDDTDNRRGGCRMSWGIQSFHPAKNFITNN